MRILKTFSPNVEIYSIDEAFIDLSFLKEKEIEDYGKKIRERVLKWTMIDSYQVYLARSFGADAILIILSAINNQTAKEIHSIAEELNMSTIVEVHTNEEFYYNINVKLSLNQAFI